MSLNSQPESPNVGTELRLSEPIYTLRDQVVNDSQSGGRMRTSVDVHGMCKPEIELQWTFMDLSGPNARGLQNRLRGAVEASWVGSIPIHPRQYLVR